VHRITVVAAIIRRGQEILISRRPQGVHLAGLWEFPGGKVETGESLESALEREIIEELGVEIDVLHETFRIAHEYPSRTVQLHFFECLIRKGEPAAIEVDSLRWVAPQDLDQYTFPEADKELVDRLKSGTSHAKTQRREQKKR
jgi:mutator protein MutT